MAKPRHDASPIDGEHDAEPHPAAVHVLIGVRHAMERIGFDHRVHTGQGTEFHGVLRIPRGAGVPRVAPRYSATALRAIEMQTPPAPPRADSHHVKGVITGRWREIKCQ